MPSIAIVGASLAGLVCAWRLQRAGHDVEVLEREALPGGRLRGVERDGFVLDPPGSLVLGDSPNLEGTAAAVGLSSELRPVVHPNTAVLRNGTLHGAQRPHLPLLELPRLLSLGGIARAARLPAQLWRSAASPTASWPERALDFDDESAASALRRASGSEALRYLMGPALYAALGVHPEALSWGIAREVLPAALHAFTGRTPVRAIHRGSARLVDALAARVPVRAGCDVLHVETQTDGARLVYEARGRESGVIADAVVIATSAGEALHVGAKLTPDERGFLEASPPARAVHVHLCLSRPPPLASSRVVFPRAEGLEIDGLVLDHHRPGCVPAGAGLVTATLGATAAARLWDAADSEVGEFARVELARTPLAELSVSDTIVRRDEAGVPALGPGSVGRLVRFAERVDRTPRLAFAASFLARPVAGPEADVVAGMSAATEIARSLRG